MGNQIGRCNKRDGGADLMEDEEDGVSMQAFADESEDEDAGAHFSVKHALELHRTGSTADKDDIQLLLNTKSALKREEDEAGIGKRNFRKEDSWHRARELGQALDSKLEEDEQKHKSPKSGKKKNSKRRGHGKGKREPVKKLFVM